VLSASSGVSHERRPHPRSRIGLAGLSRRRRAVPEEIVAATRESLNEVASELTEEMRRSLHYYQGQEGAVPLTELILSGRGALIKNLDAHLADALSMPVSIGNPLLALAENSSNMLDAELAYMAPYLSVAVGLALPRRSDMPRRINLVPRASGPHVHQRGMLAVVTGAIIVLFASGWATTCSATHSTTARTS